MKKTIYYNNIENPNRRTALFTDEHPASSHGNPIVIIKDEPYGSKDLTDRKIQLYTDDPDVVKQGAKQLYNFNLLDNPLRVARVRKGLTQKDLADKIGIPEQHLQRWEYGTQKPGTKYIFALAEILEIDPKTIL